MSEDESQRPESDPQSWLVSTDNGIGEPTVSRARDIHCWFPLYWAACSGGCYRWISSFLSFVFLSRSEWWGP